VHGADLSSCSAGVNYMSFVFSLCVTSRPWPLQLACLLIEIIFSFYTIITA